MGEYILYGLLSIIAVCLIIIVHYFSKLPKNNKSNTPFTEEQILKNSEYTKNTHLDPCVIPSDVVFDERNLPVRASRSRKKKVNYGKDFNAYLVKGGTIYHKKSCKKLNAKKITTKHIYECIADKNKKACPICKPRIEIHEWYKAKFPDSVYVKSTSEDIGIEREQVSLFDFSNAEGGTKE